MYQLKVVFFCILYYYSSYIVYCFASGVADDLEVVQNNIVDKNTTTTSGILQQQLEFTDNTNNFVKNEDEDDDVLEDDLKKHTFGVRFYAFTNPESPDDFTELKIGDSVLLAASGLKTGKPIQIYAHGFRSSQNDGISAGPAAKNRYFKNGFTNIILIDWETSVPIWEDIPIVELASYFPAIWKYLPKGCNLVKKFILFMSENQFDTELMHLLGESLGAHLVGCTGYRLQTEHGLTIGRITGLDPAGPFREIFPKENQLTEKSGRFVDAIHTAIDSFGDPDAVGHVDFYSNGGLGGKQNRCANPLKQTGIASVLAYPCAHPRAWEIWQYTIEKSVFLYGYACRKLRETSKVACAKPTEFKEEERVRFGQYGSKTARGKYYLPITDSTIKAMKTAGINLHPPVS